MIGIIINEGEGEKGGGRVREKVRKRGRRAEMQNDGKLATSSDSLLLEQSLLSLTLSTHFFYASIQWCGNTLFVRRDRSSEKR